MSDFFNLIEFKNYNLENTGKTYESIYKHSGLAGKISQITLVNDGKYL